MDLCLPHSLSPRVCSFCVSPMRTTTTTTANMAAVKKKIPEVDNHGNLEHQDSGSSDSSSSTASTTLGCTPQYDAAFYENYPRYFSPTTSEDTELLRDYYRDIVDDSARWDVAEVKPTMEWWDEDILRSGSSSPNFDSGYDNPPSSLSSASTVASFDVPEDDHQKVAEVTTDQKDLKHYEVLQITDLDDHHREGQSDRLPRMILRKTEDDVQLSRVEDSPEDVPNDQSWNYEYDNGSYDVFFESPYFSNTRLLMPYLKPIVLKPVAVFFGQKVVDTVDKDADKVDKSRMFDVTPEPELPRLPSTSSPSTMTLAMESLALVHDPYRDYHYDGLESAARLLCGPRPGPSGQIWSEVVEVSEVDVLEVDVPDDVDHLDGGHDKSSVLTTAIVEVKEEEVAEDIADNAVDTADKEVATRVDVPKSIVTRRRTSERFRHLEKREVHLRAKKDEGVARMVESKRQKNLSRNNQEENPKKEKLSREDPKVIPKKKKLPGKKNQISKSPKKKKDKKKKKSRARDPNITPEQKRERMRTYMREYMRNRFAKMTHAQREEVRERSRQNYYKRLLAENPQKFWKTLTQRINKQQK